MKPTHRQSFRITVILAIALGGTVFLSTGTALLLSSQAAYRNTTELLRESGELAVDMVEAATVRHLDPARSATETIAELISAGVVDPTDESQVESLFRGVLASSPQIAGLVLWDQDFRALRVFRNQGTMITRGDAGEDVTLTRLINALKMSGKIEWGPPKNLGGVTLVNVAKSLYRDGRYFGAVGAGVTVDELSDFVGNIAKSLGMTAFILYGDDMTLAHPELQGGGRREDVTKDLPLLPVIRLHDSVVRQFARTQPRNDSKKDGFELRMIDGVGRRYLVLSRPVAAFGSVPWQIGIYAPVEDLTAQMRRLVGSIAVGIGVLILSVLAALLLARRIARPINRIAAASEQIGRLELDTIDPLPGSRITEIDQQAEAFNRMIEALRWFETYVPRRLVGRLIAGHDPGAIASRSVDLTVMFTDIIGFTQRSEHMAPEAVAAMLNEHFALVGRCIEAEGGTLDKYIGDSVMAFWGAPEDQPDHAARACRAAVAIARALETANAAAGGLAASRIKIAIHSGPAVVGNIGAPNRINYTVVGDMVNTCSRIETLCREFDDGRTAVILVSQDAVERALRDDRFTFTPVGTRTVKGRDDEVTLSRLEAVGG